MENNMEKVTKNSQDLNETMGVMDGLATYLVEVTQTTTLKFQVKSRNASEAEASVKLQLEACDNDLDHLALQQYLPVIDTPTPSIKVIEQ